MTKRGEASGGDLRAVPNPMLITLKRALKQKPACRWAGVLLRASAAAAGAPPPCGCQGRAWPAWGAGVRLFGLLNVWGERPLIAVS